MSDVKTIAVYNAQAQEYARMTESEARDKQLLAFIAALPNGARVLDLGCGPGITAAVMANAGLKVDATDASSQMVAMAAKNPGVTAWQATFDQIEGDAIYDGIWANFSLLHAPRANMPRHLIALHKAAKPGARFHIGVKTGTGEERDRLGRLYTYFEEQELVTLLKDAGFSTTNRHTGRGTGLSGEMANWIVLTAHA